MEGRVVIGSVFVWAFLVGMGLYLVVDAVAGVQRRQDDRSEK